MTSTIQAAFITLAALFAGLVAAASPAGAVPTDPVHRIAIISAYEPEWLKLREGIEDRQEKIVNGTVFVTGEIAAKPVVLFLSGISIVNAAMTTQLALDHFTVDRIVYSGIAGGVDPSLNIGDVVVPQAWSQYLEAVFAREAGNEYRLPPFAERAAPNFGMIFPQPVQIARAPAQPQKMFWFQVDAAMLDVAKTLGTGEALLEQCTAARQCLGHKPRLVVGGNGVSGQAFVDNKTFREYVSSTFQAAVLDMESAAVAHVAYAGGVPFIAIRSLSDLAGGGDGENEITTFFQLASDNSAAVVKAFIKALP